LSSGLRWPECLTPPVELHQPAAMASGYQTTITSVGKIA
jgi:hypothetical protein